MFLSLWWRWRWPLTISSPSIPTQTSVTWGLPSLFSVVTCASGPLLMRLRIDSGIVIVILSAECTAQPHSAHGLRKELVHTRRTDTLTSAQDDVGKGEQIRGPFEKSIRNWASL